jgi:hypothetical protein
LETYPPLVLASGCSAKILPRLFCDYGYSTLIALVLQYFR